jgi:predicted Ser/Thr protein kinase
MTDPTIVSHPQAGEPAPSLDGIPGYRVERLIASGGMGDVYLAEDENLRRLVAIKRIHPERSNDPDYKQRFTREALTVAGFRHDNIVMVYASGWVDEKQFIVMEYIDGGTLFEKMNSPQALTGADAAEISYRMADALAYAHERNVIHRDFKPSNVLLRQNGSPVLSDFGVAKSEVTRLDATQRGETAVGVVIGNLRYMAPEQALGQVLSNRVDIYSFGLVLHEMLTGELPADHPVRTKQDKRAIVRSVGPAFADLINRCLQAEPTDRPSAAECRDWLEPLAAKPASKPRWRGAVAVAAGILVASSGFFALRSGFFSRHSQAGMTPGGSSALTVARMPSDTQVFVDGAPDASATLSLSPGLHELVAVAPGYYGEIRRLTVSGSRPESTSFALDSAVLPEIEELERFLKLADAPTLSEADLSGVTERTLHTVLRAKLLRQGTKAAELGELSRDVETLRRFGDARAAVAALLIGSIQAGRISRSQVSQSLLAASKAGDAMASLFVAIAYRDSIPNPENISPSDPRFQDYCRYMTAAAAQGWSDVADQYARRDHCAN